VLGNELTDQTNTDGESTSIYLAIVTISLVIVAVLFSIVLIVCLRKALWNCLPQVLRTLLTKLLRKLMFNSVLRQILLSYYILSIDTLLSLKTMQVDTLQNKIGCLISIAMTLFLVVFPVKSYNFLRSERKYLKT